MRVAGIKVLGLVGLLTLAAPAGPAQADEVGESVFRRKCQACHTVTPGQHRVGPSLHGMFDRPGGTAPGFRNYSKGLKEWGQGWDDAALDAYLADPRALIKDNRMIFLGLREGTERQAVIAYLKKVAK